MLSTSHDVVAHTALQQLSLTKQLIDTRITDYCRHLLDETENQYGQYSREALAAYCSVLQRGGKRLRGALLMHSYYMLGGTNQQLALQAALAVEMIHAYVLLIDDICDHSTTRRGDATAHIMLRNYHERHGLFGDSTHFGLATATIAAMTGNHLAQLELSALPIDDKIKIAMLTNLNDCLVTTSHGQINDIFNEAIRSVDEAQVRRMLTWKTAYYTFLNPLQLGAILAEADMDQLQCLYDYSMNLGLSFQITDDILGIFGDEFESGKSAQDDMKEGKITVLVSRALQRANPQQKQQLLASLGNQLMTTEDHQACRRILQDTGALDYAKQLADHHAQLGYEALESAPSTWDPEQLDFLRGLALYITHRTS